MLLSIILKRDIASKDIEVSVKILYFPRFMIREISLVLWMLFLRVSLYWDSFDLLYFTFRPNASLSLERSIYIWSSSFCLTPCIKSYLLIMPLRRTNVYHRVFYWTIQNRWFRERERIDKPSGYIYIEIGKVYLLVVFFFSYFIFLFYYFHK